MNVKNENERLAVLETSMSSIEKRLTGIESSMSALHGKFDLIAQNYVAKETFEEYKKNKSLEKILWFIVGSVITGLTAFFLKESNI